MRNDVHGESFEKINPALEVAKSKRHRHSSRIAFQIFFPEFDPALQDVRVVVVPGGERLLPTPLIDVFKNDDSFARHAACLFHQEGMILGMVENKGKEDDVV